MNDLISVIIPVYNTGEKIINTLECVINQDYNNLEIILVNDASNDNTIKTAQGVLKNSSRLFKIITHEKNKGVSAARNTGFESANGKFIAFIDSDDLIKENFISHLYKIAVENNSDVAVCSFIDRYFAPDRDIEWRFKLKKHFFKNGSDLIFNWSVFPIWCCLYKKSFLDAIGIKFFETCSAGEDVEFQKKAMTHAKNIIFSDECLYIYVHTPQMGSISETKTKAGKIRRYRDSSQAHLRTAKYIIKNSGGNLRLKNFAERVLLPETFVRILTTYSKQHDIKKFNNLLKKLAVKKILCSTLNFHTLIKKPELFFKALLVILAPGIYYRIRS